MSVVTESIDVFLDWAIGITTILIIYYIIKLFVVGKPSKEEEAKLGERRKKLKEFIEKKKGKIKKKEKKKKLDPVKGLLVKCIYAAEEGITYMEAGTRKEAKKARNKVKEFNKNIRIVWRELRILRDKSKGEERKALERLAASAHHLIIDIEEKKFRERDIDQLLESSKEIISKLNRFKLICGDMITRLDKLMK